MELAGAPRGTSGSGGCAHAGTDRANVVPGHSGAELSTPHRPKKTVSDVQPEAPWLPTACSFLWPFSGRRGRGARLGYPRARIVRRAPLLGKGALHNPAFLEPGAALVMRAALRGVLALLVFAVLGCALGP